MQTDLKVNHVIYCQEIKHSLLALFSVAEVTIFVRKDLVTFSRVKCPQIRYLSRRHWSVNAFGLWWSTEVRIKKMVDCQLPSHPKYICCASPNMMTTWHTLVEEACQWIVRGLSISLINLRHKAGNQSSTWVVIMTIAIEYSTHCFLIYEYMNWLNPLWTLCNIYFGNNRRLLEVN